MLLPLDLAVRAEAASKLHRTPRDRTSCLETTSAILGSEATPPSFDHPEEYTVIKTIKDHREDAPAFFASMVLSDDPSRADVLSLLSRSPENMVEWAIDIAAAALKDKSTPVRESAISALEAWGGVKVKDILMAHRDPQPWLTDYAQRIAENIK